MSRDSDQDSAARSQLVAQTSVLLDKLHQSATDLYGVRDDATLRLGASITQFNSLLDQIGSLNATISSSTSSGRTPNDLMDQRDLLVKKISDLADITTRSLLCPTVSRTACGTR